MTTNYVTFMLLNLAGGLAVLLHFLWKGLDDATPRHWAPAFGMAGFAAALTGFAMMGRWPLAGPYNIAFGEMSALFGLLFMGAALSLLLEGSLMPLAVYAVFAGLAAITVGLRISSLGLTLMPPLATAGYVLTGLGGLLAGPVLVFRKQRLLRLGAMVSLGLALLIWLMVSLMAYWGHLAEFAAYAPKA